MFVSVYVDIFRSTRWVCKCGVQLFELPSHISQFINMIFMFMCMFMCMFSSMLDGVRDLKDKELAQVQRALQVALRAVHACFSLSLVHELTKYVRKCLKPGARTD